MKRLLLVKVLLCICFSSYGTTTKNKIEEKPTTSFIPQIIVLGPDMMTPITNGNTSPDFINGTLYFDTAVDALSPSLFTIQNNGTSDLNISNITITGADASDFTIDGTPPTLIGSGLNEQLQVNFTPQSSGVKNATVSITSDDPSNGTYTFAIQGTAFNGGTGLDFDGVDDYISFLNGNYLLSNNLTIELWIKPEISGTAEHYILDTKNGFEGHSLHIDMLSKLNFSFFTPTGIKFLTSTSSLTNNQWQHIAVSFDGSQYKIFINGIEDTSLALSETIMDSTDNLRIGDIAQGGGQPYAGAIDELRVWEEAFDTCRITAQSSCQITGSETSLLAYYNFNNGVVNANNFPIYTTLDPNHNITSGIPPQGTLTNFGLTGTSSNWIDSTSNGISGTCATYLAPEISITAGTDSITNGDTTVSTNNNTQFGNVELGQAEPLSYNITNSETADLTISAITITPQGDFSIIAEPTTIPAGTSETLTILFSPTTISTQQAVVSIASNECDENPFTFAIEASGVQSATGLNFDGTNDHVNTAHNSAFNTNTFTLEANFKTSSTIDNQPIISKYNNTDNNGFSLQLTSDGRIRFYYAVANVTSTVNGTTTGLNDGNWHNVAVTLENSTLLIYLDGALEKEFIYANVPDAPTNNESLFLGFSGYSGAYFDGDLDEIRFWSRSVCIDELNAQRSCELTGSESGLLAYYKFNQGFIETDNSSESTLTDSSGNNNNGTLTDFDLSGTASNYINSTTNGISGTCSIAIPEINIQGNGTDIVNGDTTPDSNDNTDAGTVSVGNSSEMDFFVRNTNGTGSLNVSGVFLSGDTSDFTIVNNPSNNPIAATESASLKINFNPTSSGLKTVVVTVDSDDCDEPFYTFTIQGTAPVPGTGLDFDGTDDIVTIPHNTSQNSLDFSVDFWIKTTGGTGGVINKFSPDGNNGWRINLDGGRIEFYYYASASNYITRLLSSATYVADGNWHHVAVTLNSGNARCYIDGTLARTTGWNGTATATTTTNNIQLGYAAADTPTGDSGGYFDGQLDELRIWTKTLSEFQVGTLNGCTTDMAQTDLVASYNFNQGIAESDNSGETTLTDGSGNSFDGTLSNFALNGSTSNWIDASANAITGSCDCTVAGGVTLTTQTEVDTYVATLGTCGIIEGDITINGTIIDLSGFSNIHTISGDLHLEGDIANDLSGFSTLTTLDGDFTLQDMPNITSIAAFSGITSLGGDFEVDNLDLLTEISILSQLTSINKITITGNAILAIIAFNQLQTTTNNLTVTFNGGLSSFSIPQLTQVSSEFRMNNNGSGLNALNLPLLESTGNFILADMSGVATIDLPELLTINGTFSIGGSFASLTTFNIPKLSSVTNNFSFRGASTLTTLNLTVLSSVTNDFSVQECILLDTITAPMLTSIGNNVTLDELAITSLSCLQDIPSISTLLIRDLPALVNVQGVNALTSLNGFSITNCDLITSLEGFPNLNVTSLDSFSISSSSGITTLSNSFLESLTTIGELSISFNSNLIEVDGLQNITSLTGSGTSTIRDCDALQSVNMYALRNVTGNLTIRNQDQAATSLCGLYDYVTIGDGATTLQFAGTNSTDWDSVQDILDNCNAGVNLKVFLQGAALNPNTGEESLMRDDLRVADLIPTTSPYSDALTINSAVFNNTGDNAIVDWVWVELRDSADNTSLITSRSALLQRDGDIVHTDGVSLLYLSAAAGDYYIVIKHRNHLGIITTNTVALSSVSTSVDFTNGNSQITFGSNAQTTSGMQSGVVAMWSGNTNDDTVVQYSGTSPDTPNILSEVLNDAGNFLNFPTFAVSGYNKNDVNMDGNTQYSGTTPDTPFILQNVLAHSGNFLNFSTYQILEQLPEN